MPKPTSDQIQTSKNWRAFTQRGGPLPTNAVRYAGSNEQYLAFGDVDNPVRGDVTAIKVHDPARRGSFLTVAESMTAPDLPSASIDFYVKHGGISWIGADLTCPNNFYEASGQCNNPSDLQYGWSDYVDIYSYGQASSRTRSNGTVFEGEDGTMQSVDFTFDDVYSIGKLFFQESASTTIDREVIDLTYGSTAQCMNCGAPDNGAQRIYGITASSGGSPTNFAEVVYTANGGTSWSQQNVTGMAGSTTPSAIDVAGEVLIVVSQTDGGYYFAPINRFTGAPGTWTLVTAGFNASGAPRDLYVAAANDVFFVGQGGYLYESTSLSAGVTSLSASAIVTTANLRRVHGAGDTVVAVGESGVILITNNRGVAWKTATIMPTNATITAIRVMDDYRYWIGTSGGAVYYTTNGGESWTQLATSVVSGAVVIDDITFVTDEVGYIAARTSTPAGRLFTTFTGGNLWSSSADSVPNPRLGTLPATTRINRIAVPLTGTDETVAANNVALGGLSAGGTDGVIYLGIANLV